MDKHDSSTAKPETYGSKSIAWELEHGHTKEGMRELNQSLHNSKDFQSTWKNLQNDLKTHNAKHDTKLPELKLYDSNNKEIDGTSKFDQKSVNKVTFGDANKDTRTGAFKQEHITSNDNTKQNTTTNKHPDLKVKPEEKATTPEVKAKTPEEKAKTPEEKAKTPEEKAKTPEEKAKTPEEKAKTPEEKAKTLEEKAKTPEVKAKTPEEKAKTPEEKAKTPEEKAKTQEEKAKTPEEKAKTPEEKAKTPEEKAKTPEEKAKTPEEKAKTAEGNTDAKTLLQDFKDNNSTKLNQDFGQMFQKYGNNLDFAGAAQLKDQLIKSGGQEIKDQMNSGKKDVAQKEYKLLSDFLQTNEGPLNMLKETVQSMKDKVAQSAGYKSSSDLEKALA